MLNIKYYSFYILSLIILCNGSISADIPSGYKNSWVNYEDIKRDSKEFKFHCEYAQKMYDIMKNSSQQKPNIACFGISVHLKNEPPIVIPFNFFVTSELNRNYIPSEQVTHENKKSAKKTETDTLVQPFEGYFILSIPNVFNTDPFINGTSKKRLELFLNIVEENLSKYDSFYNIKSLINFYHNNKDLIKSNDNIGKICNSNSEEYNGINRKLGSLLHCEQIILLQLLFRDGYKHGLFEYLSSELNKKYKHNDNLSYVTLDIITYKDMCPKCFATCECFFDNLKNNILSNLFPGNNIDDIQFQIVISSLQPYAISKDDFTRNSSDTDKCLEEFYAVPSCKYTKLNEKIIQFVNPWLIECRFISICENVNQAIQKSSSLSELLKTLTEDITKIKILEENIIKTPQNYYSKLYSSFRDKYSKLLNKSLQHVLKISLYDHDLLDISINTLKGIQDTFENNQYQQEELEHNNNNTKN